MIVLLRGVRCASIFDKRMKITPWDAYYHRYEDFLWMVIKRHWLRDTVRLGDIGRGVTSRHLRNSKESCLFTLLLRITGSHREMVLLLALRGRCFNVITTQWGSLHPPQDGQPAGQPPRWPLSPFRTIRSLIFAPSCSYRAAHYQHEFFDLFLPRDCIGR